VGLDVCLGGENASVLLTKKPWRDRRIASICVGSLIETETGIPNIFVGPLGFFHKYSPVINILVFEKCPVPKIEGKTFKFYFFNILLLRNEMLKGLKKKPVDLASCYNNAIMVHIQTIEI
jgi:hypothetical protein